MINKIIIIFHKLCKIKFRFDFPLPEKILLFDESHSLILKEIIKKNFSILKVRDKKEIYFWIFLKQIIFFDFKFLTYCKNYIKFISPKVLITFIDTDRRFFELNNTFTNIQFLSIQNGCRVEKNTMFYNKLYTQPKKLKCDHVFVFNKFYIKEYKKIIDSKYHVLGNFKNNIVKIDKTKINGDFLFLSQFSNSNKMNRKIEIKLVNFLKLYLNKSGKKLHIILRNRDSLKDKNDEINFYNKIFQSKCIFPKTTDWKKPYEILDKFENIIFMYSTLGFEAIARKKKVAIFSPIKDFNGKPNFAWPATFQKKYNFFSAKNLTYNEIKRVLDNVKNCSQINWEKKYYSVVKDQLYLNKNNTKLKKVIFGLL
jgi:surface carbohydrate biosynthesis protein